MAPASSETPPTHQLNPEEMASLVTMSSQGEKVGRGE